MRAGPSTHPARRRATTLAVAAILAASGSATANPLVYFGLGTRGAAMAGAMTAVVDDQASTLYNPAGAAATADLRVGVGGTFYSHSTQAGGRATVEEDVYVPWVGVAFAIPMGGPFKDRCYSALSVSLPTKHARLTRIFLTPPDVPYFVPYTNATERITVAPVFAFKPFDFLMLGGGFDIFPFDSPNKIVGSVGPSGGLELRGTLYLQTDFVPRGGILLDAGKLWPRLETLRFGIVYRHGFDQHFALPATLDIGFPIDLDIEGWDQFVPRQIAVGLSYDPLPEVTVALDAVWQDWSEHRSPRLKTGVRGLENLIPLDELEVVAYEPPPPDLSDTVSPRVGVEVRAPRWSWGVLALRAGYAFEPSPGPATAEDPLLFANARHLIAAGASLQPEEGTLSDLPMRLAFDVSLQAHLLEPQDRRVPAEMSASGIEEVVTGKGTILAIGASVNVRY